ncbi:hypothetical protein DLM_3907 [Aquitalea magnusonii]|uniref:Uncharacterized protein n=1 Tax=Aquitalea magnusonii TaxID=332411 RepID=A0A3G9GTZ6_9NEIS|nr:hypothetical protein DLM_3907 [Aquitalea magnusonii]
MLPAPMPEVCAESGRVNFLCDVWQQPVAGRQQDPSARACCQ